MTAKACCICSSLLDTYDAATEKPIIPSRHLGCCDRIMCLRCTAANPRYEKYCPYCQISTQPSPLPQGLKDPPAYSDIGATKKEKGDEDQAAEEDEEELPAYSTHAPVPLPLGPDSKREVQEDILHFLRPEDSLGSLSIAYAVPLPVLRRTNNIFADHLLQGRRTVLIPGEYCQGGASLSPTPVEGEEEEMRRNKVRRWMVACKVAEYDVALLYLEQSGYDLDAAIQAYRDDDRWEKEHPLENGKGKDGKKTPKSVGMRRFVGSSASGPSR